MFRVTTLLISLSFFLVIGCGQEDATPRIEIISISPPGGEPGDLVRIEGRNFSEEMGGNLVFVGDSLAEVIEANSNELTFIVPEGAVTSKITVETGKHRVFSTNEFIIIVDLVDVLDAFMEDNPNIPSLAMTVVKDGEIMFSHGIGLYDLDLTKVPDSNTLYTTSSISKLVISVAVMQQVELGNLDLDEDISSYLGFEVRNPNFPKKIITARMLMKHSASLSNPVFGEADVSLFSAYTADTKVDLFPRIADAITPTSPIYNPAIWMNVEPGTLSKNSNYGMTLLGYLVEKLSGLHFTDYSKQNIFNPLGMEATSYYYPDLNEENVAISYSPSTNNPFPPFTLFWYPAGLMYTSGNDWAKFLTAILDEGILDGNRILSESSVSELLNTTEPPNNNLAYGSSIGLIWREAAVNSGWVGHTAGGSETHITEINLEHKIGYVLFTNETALGGQIGPGSKLNRTIHRWLQERIDNL